MAIMNLLVDRVMMLLAEFNVVLVTPDQLCLDSVLYHVRTDNQFTASKIRCSICSSLAGDVRSTTSIDLDFAVDREIIYHPQNNKCERNISKVDEYVREIGFKIEGSHPIAGFDEPQEDIHVEVEEGFDPTQEIESPF
ncbi:hypothetical protein E3N88_02405 [Mikania micrantha]|uniref:Uncharacterized protein n=1 Tax=Mikania micrantha TaxID=192012 RepID=A0A5N6Q3W0_9ASTR|nr:hypothetical protein E3N88_02405 [Mikania micrantha]